MSSGSTLPGLLDLLSRHTPVLLPHARAAGRLRHAFDLAQRGQDLGVWEPAPALSWTQWTQGLWSDLVVQGREPRLLLNSAQEHAVWAEIVAESPGQGAAALSSPHSLAELARSAFHLAASFQATGRLRACASTRDSRLFDSWAEGFLQRCASRDLLSPALLDDALLAHLQAGCLAAPSILHLAGFNDLLPAQQALLNALESQGTTIVKHALNRLPHPGDLRATVLTPNESDELTFAARWVRQFLTSGAAQITPPSVAIVLPDLAADRPALESVLRDILAPELQHIAADLSSTPWEFSAGPPLATLPLIDTALSLAHWTAQPLPLERVSSLLLSPFLGGPADRNRGAAFDASVLRRTPFLRPEIGLASLLHLAGQRPSAAAPSWLAPVHQGMLRAGDLTRPRTFAEWTEVLRGLTRAAGWPGSRPLTANEFEATRAWDSVLDIIATLDFAGRRVPFADALQAIDRRARSAPFSPPSTHAPVQIMSPDEAAGTSFDAVLFLRATDANWPPPARPNPLLGWALQRELRMPGADPALAAAHASALTAALLARSGTLLFTSAAENLDGPQRPSALLAQLHIPTLPAADLLAPLASRPPLSLDAVYDLDPLPALPSPHVRGGATVLKLQAACGFRAYAEIRLQARPLETPAPGFDARESGNFIHSALQRFWNKVLTRDNLAAMPTAERSALLSKCIASALGPETGPLGPPNDWDRAYLQLQKQRLHSLLSQWLAAELQRGPFSVVTGEQEMLVEAGPLQLDVRFDRIDHVGQAPGSSPGFVLVDYKTGASGHPAQWATSRPDDPQLPLYALSYAPEELKGLAFAKVRAGEMKWLGYQAEPGILPASRITQVVDLPNFLSDWRDVLHQLAADFAEGKAAAFPRQYPQTCERCAQRPLCRLDPSTLPNASDDGLPEDIEGIPAEDFADA